MKHSKQLMILLILLAVVTACYAQMSTTTGSVESNTSRSGNITTPYSTTSSQGLPRTDGLTTGQIIPTEGLAPVETKQSNTNYQPAFPGQTRGPGAKTKTPYKIQILTKDLVAPWSVKELPNGQLVVTEKAGSLRIVSQDGVLSNPILGFPDLEANGQGGLLDVLPALDFEQSRILYFTLAEKTNQGSLTAVGKGRLSEDNDQLTDFLIIYRAIPYFNGNAHFGSRLVFDQNGDLLVTTGERQSNETRNNAQTLDNGYGKVIRITTQGDPGAANPFIGQIGALPEIYSYGHRNPQGLAIQPGTGAIWISEMGPRGGDELNIIQAGKNYGWPAISYGIEYAGQPVGEGITVKAGMEQPVYYWDPIIAPSGITFYDSTVIPEWTNNLFISSLAGKHIARIILDGTKVVGEERLLTEEGQRFRDITGGSDGAIYAVTDSGWLYRIGK